MVSHENSGDESLLAKVDAVIITLDLDVQELPCWSMVHDQVFPQQLCLYLDRCFRSRLCLYVPHGDVIEIQLNEHFMVADIEVRLSLSLCEPEGEEECINIVVPERRCLPVPEKGFSDSINDWW
jgi:hypothetical protein